MVTSNIEKLLHIRQFGGESVIRQAVEKYLAVPLLGDPVIQQDQHSPVALAADQPSKSLFQSDGRLRNLVVVKRIAPGLANILDARVHHGIANEVYTALQTHIADGQETPLVTIEAWKLFEVQKYLSITNH